ncbi:hypothetical protein PI124_g884 [Phytophthora idaei]|nr:hypothetical protein PI125_g5355 [Phytophthora idaei]KAG3254565.1 hypothetical protein PI124_g884 [Phytophthora idaei]
MHIPNEDDAEFVDEAKAKPVPENAMMQQMMTMMQQTQNLLAQQQQQLARSSRSPRRVEPAATVHDEYVPKISVVTENTPSVAGTGRWVGPDKFTQDGLSHGHVTFECGAPRQQNNGNYNRGQQANSNGDGTGLRQRDSGGQRLGGSGKCFFCSQTSHRVAECPAKKALLAQAEQGLQERCSRRGPLRLSTDGGRKKGVLGPLRPRHSSPSSLPASRTPQSFVSPRLLAYLLFVAAVTSLPLAIFSDFALATAAYWLAHATDHHNLSPSLIVYSTSLGR